MLFYGGYIFCNLTIREEEHGVPSLNNTLVFSDVLAVVANLYSYVSDEEVYLTCTHLFTKAKGDVVTL